MRMWREYRTVEKLGQLQISVAQSTRHFVCASGARPSKLVKITFPHQCRLHSDHPRIGAYWVVSHPPSRKSYHWIRSASFPTGVKDVVASFAPQPCTAFQPLGITRGESFLYGQASDCLHRYPSVFISLGLVGYGAYISRSPLSLAIRLSLTLPVGVDTAAGSVPRGKDRDAPGTRS
jgi:hypothetical protein